jgi:hypothetical protein
LEIKRSKFGMEGNQERSEIDKTHERGIRGRI